MKIGLLGFGTIGTAVYELINIQKKYPLTDNETPPVITKILEKAPGKQVNPKDPHAVILQNADEIINDPEIDLVIAACGDNDFEYRCIKKALCNQKHVITSNKAVISEYFEELVTLAKENHVLLRYEGCVGGGVPIISSLKEQVKTNTIHKIHGIFNCTTNFILSEMTQNHVSFSEALSRAQALGFAEADPSADIDGHDTASKLAILASVAFGCHIRKSDIRRYSLRNITPEDIQFCGAKKSVIKYIGYANRTGQHYDCTVIPAVIPETAMLSDINGLANLFTIKGDVIGELAFYGLASGSSATANAVLFDVLSVQTELKYGLRPMSEHFDREMIKSNIPDFTRQFYLRTDYRNDAEKNTILRLTKPYRPEITVDAFSGKIHFLIDEISFNILESLTATLRQHHIPLFQAAVLNEN